MRLHTNPDEQHLVNLCFEYEQLYFQDMTGETGVIKSISDIAVDMYDYVPLPTIEQADICISDTLDCEGRYNIETKIITISQKCSDIKSVLLHEMIHFYIENLIVLNPALCEVLLLDLYKQLSGKIPNLDDLIYGHSDLYFLDILEQSGGSHGVLFYLKSLDIDLQCGFELGTTMGYGYNSAE